jgi:TPR repeat protein
MNYTKKSDTVFYLVYFGVNKILNYYLICDVIIYHMTNKISLLYNDKKYDEAFKKGITYLKNAKQNTKQYYAVHTLIHDMINQDLLSDNTIKIKNNDDLSIIQGHLYLKQGDKKNAIECYDKDNGMALYHLGLMYENNEYKAISLFKKAMNKGNREGQYKTGEYYWRQKKYDKALDYYLMSSKQGYHMASFRLGHMYQVGYSGYIDYRKALEFYTLSEKQGNNVVYKQIIILQYSFNKVCEDYCENYIEKGDKNAEAVGAFYHRDLKKIDELALQNNPIALCCIANRFNRKNELYKFNEYMKKSAEFGYSIAYAHLGRQYTYNNNIEEAMKYYKLAFENDGIIDYEETAKIFYKHNDFDMAYQLLNRVYKRKSTLLAKMYILGQGVPTNFWKALENMSEYSLYSHNGYEFEPIMNFCYKTVYEYKLKDTDNDFLRPVYARIKKYCVALDKYDKGEIEKPTLDNRKMNFQTVINCVLKYKDEIIIRLTQRLDTTNIYKDIQGLIIDYI